MIRISNFHEFDEWSIIWIFNYIYVKLFRDEFGYLPETNLELKIGIKKEAGICSMHTNDLVETIFYLAGTCAWLILDESLGTDHEAESLQIPIWKTMNRYFYEVFLSLYLLYYSSGFSEILLSSSSCRVQMS